MLEEAHKASGNPLEYAATDDKIASEIGNNIITLPPKRREARGAANPSSSLRSAVQFVGEYVPLAYVVEPALRTSSLYTLTAKTGGGKTAFAVILALAVATGRKDILGLEVERGRVAYCAFENPDDVRMRLMAAAWHLGVDLADLGDRLLVVDVRARPEELVASLRTAAEAEPLVLVIVDTFAAAFDGKDVNDNVQAGEFVRRLRPLTQIEGLPAVLIAAHPIKNASDEQLVPYGGGAILNEVDGNLTLAKKAAGTTRLHWQGKFRGLEFGAIPFAFAIVATPDVVDNKGRQVKLPVLRPCSIADIEQQTQTDVEREIQLLKAVSLHPNATQRNLSSETGISKSAIDRLLIALRDKKLIEKAPIGRGHRITKRGEDELNRLG